jgi:hypothetical protein
MWLVLFASILIHAEGNPNREWNLQKTFTGYEFLAQFNYCPLSKESMSCVSLGHTNDSNQDQIEVKQDATKYADCLMAQRKIKEYLESDEFKKLREQLEISPSLSLFIAVNSVVQSGLPANQDLDLIGETKATQREILSMNRMYEPTARANFVKSHFSFRYQAVAHRESADGTPMIPQRKCMTHLNLMINGTDAIGTNHFVDPKGALNRLKAVLKEIAKSKDLNLHGGSAQQRQAEETARLNKLNREIVRQNLREAQR